MVPACESATPYEPDFHLFHVPILHIEAELLFISQIDYTVFIHCQIGGESGQMTVNGILNIST